MTAVESKPGDGGGERDRVIPVRKTSSTR